MHYTLTQAAVKLNRSVPIVLRLLLANGIGTRHGAAWLLTDADIAQLEPLVPARGRPRKIPDDIRNDLRKRLASGVDAAELARELGVHEQTVLRAVAEPKKRAKTRRTA